MFLDEEVASIRKMDLLIGNHFILYVWIEVVSFCEVGIIFIDYFLSNSPIEKGRLNSPTII